MANLHAIYLKTQDIREIALPILKKRFKQYGFRDADVREEETFDGDPILRMVAHVEKQVPARILLDANEDIHVSLRTKGEERFVFLSTKRPGENEQEADEDEE